MATASHDTPALEALTEAWHRAFHADTGRRCANDAELSERILAALTANSFTIAPEAEAEAGRAVLALPRDRWWVVNHSRGIGEWRFYVRWDEGEAHYGPTLPAAIAAALQDEATDGR